MSDFMENIHNGKVEKSSRSTFCRVVRWIFLSIGIFVILLIVGAGVATWWLTPERMTELINREASGKMNAEVKVYNARFTLWSSFPHLCIELDSMKIISHSFDSIGPELKKQLPSGASCLVSTSGIRGGIDLISLLRGRIYLKDLEVDSMDMNLVAVADSITNYNIFPSGDKSGGVPYITVNKLKFNNPLNIKFYNCVTKSQINVDLRDVALNRDHDDIDRYQLIIDGYIDAVVNKLQLLQGFPFSLNGEVGLKFAPFAITAKDYSIDLGNTHGKLDIDLKVGKDPQINMLSYRISDFNVMGLLGYLPHEYVPISGSVDVDIVMNATAQLKTPYRFYASELPSAEVNVNVVEGKLSYLFDTNNSYTIRNMEGSGKLFFDGGNMAGSRFDLPRFRLTGEGMNLNLSAHVDNFVSAPLIRFKITGFGNASEIGKSIKSLSSLGLKGDLSTTVSGSFALSDITGGNINDVDIKGEASLTDFRLRYPAKSFKASGKTLKLDIRGKMGSFAADRIPFNVKITSAGLRFIDHGNATDVSLTGVSAHGYVNADLTARKPVAAALDFNCESVRGKLEGSTLDLRGIQTKFSAKKLSKPVKLSHFSVPEAWDIDDKALGMFPHSSKYIMSVLPDSVRRELLKWKIHASLKIAGGELRTPSFPVLNRFDNLYAEASLDSIRLHKLHLSSQSSGMDLAAHVRDLRRFICGTGISPLYVNLYAALDTIQINQIAGAYERGLRITKNETYVDNTVDDRTDRLTASDTTALLIPRNLFADIHASAKMTRYMNLRLEDLAADISIGNGNADVKRLDISSDFGAVGLDLKMNTGNIERMGLTLNGGIHDVNVVNFFKNFHTLLLMMPQMKNLSGILSADINANMGYFPNMFVDIPSVKADMLVKGRGLTVHQDRFIRKVTRMLMIHNSGDIHIPDMNVHAQVADNLLMLYPFDFDFDRYELRMEGVNNFNGDMYYHVGVKKSPVPIPFGINIKGNFSDPQLRFGGVTYKEDQGGMVTRSIIEDHKVNIVRVVRKYFKEFVHKAAQSDTTPESEYIFK